MKALTIWQPWASAIAAGVKRIETRAWCTRYRGPLLIHAARTTMGLRAIRQDRRLWCAALAWDWWAKPADAFRELPLGALIARAELVDCVDTFPVQVPVDACAEHGAPCGRLELDLGDYSEGRFALILANVEPLPAPIPFRGRQGMFDVPDSVLPDSVLEDHNPARPPVEALR